MPELPEVETVRRGLIPALDGRLLARVEARRPDLRVPLPENFAKRLTGRRVMKLERRAKYLLLHLDDHMVLVIHLGMSGSLRVEGKGLGQFHHERGKLNAHDHVVFETDQGVCVTYNDPRRFGLMTLVSENGLTQDRLFADMGPEPLGPDLTPDYLWQAASTRRTPVKSLLLDQHIVAGLGNIYVCEALHRAHIHPERQASTLKKAEVKRLVPAIQDILLAAIDAGGSSLRDFQQTSGELGYFQHQFAVYDRADQPCPTPACKGTISRLVQSNRSTYFCPSCQK
jgi:formamidopyrimidine-DNA glycosylase